MKPNLASQTQDLKGVIVEDKEWKEVPISDLQIKGDVIWYVGERTQKPVDIKGRPIPMPREVRNISPDAFFNNTHFSALRNMRSSATGSLVFNIKNANDLYWVVKNMDAQTYLDKLENLLPANATRSDKLVLAGREAEKMKKFLFGGYEVHIDDIFHLPGVKLPKEEVSEEVTAKKTRTRKKVAKEDSTLNLD